MPDRLTPAAFADLADVRDDPCITICLPATRRGTAVETDLRFRAILAKIERRLKTLRMPKRDIEDLLGKPRKLLDDHLFWQVPGKGYAVFCSPKHFAAYRLPSPCEEHLAIGEQYNLTPLLPHLPETKERFFVLAVSQKQVRLLEGSASGAREILRKEWSGGIREALGEEKQEKLLQGHTVRVGGGKRGSVLHGQGGWKDVHKRDLLEYLHMIAKEVAKVLRGEHAPLVFAGADPLFGYYRSLQRYGALLPEAIRGNPDRLSDRELVARAGRIVREHLH